MTWRLLDFRAVTDERGALNVVEGAHLPFDIQRVFFVHSVPDGATRGGHAHRKLEQVVIAVAGSFDVLVDDGDRRDRVRLDRPDVGLYLGPGVWDELVDFSPDAVCLVLASLPFDAEDYVRDRDAFAPSI